MEITFYYNQYKLWELYVTLKKYHELVSITETKHDCLVITAPQNCYEAVKHIADKYKC